VVSITGLRNPCSQIEGFQPNLLAAVLERKGGRVIRKAGVMGVVTETGVVRAGDHIRVRLPVLPHRALEPV
jgi:MOSC domain-containing protein YiiM